MAFRLSLEAEDDILRITEDGIRLFGPGQARRYHVELFEMFDLLAASPRIARLRNELSPPMRIHPFKAHLIVYVIEGEDGVYVIRVLHGHADWLSDLT